MNAVYVRVSTDEQARSGYSLQDQLTTCCQRLTTMGLTPLQEYIDDGYSGEFLERPALDRLRSDLRSGIIQHVMVYDPDRLSRNLTNQLILAEEIEKAGAKLLFITGDYDASPEGRLFFSMRGAISAFEKAKIRERTMRGKRAKVLSGKPLFGRSPYGYSCNKETQQYVIVPEEAEIVREIFNRYTSKMYGFVALAADLRAAGIVNRSGNPFEVSVLHRMISNEMYAGTKWAFQTYQQTIAQKKRKAVKRDKTEWIAITIPAIIDRHTWQKAAALRNQNRAVAKRNAKHEYLLSGIIKCAVCGYAMHGVTYSKHQEKDYSYYVCTAYINNHSCTNKKSIPVRELDAAVWQEIVTGHHQKSLIVNPTKKQNKQHDLFENQLATLKARQATILKWVSTGTIDLEAAEGELKNLTAAMSALKDALALPRLEPTMTPEEFFKAASFAEKRRILLRLQIAVCAKKETDATTYIIQY